jgi:O-antigen/teichoic acid export membrane protein
MLGEAALGALRAGELLVSPMALGLVALNYALVPPLARRAHRIRARHAAIISAVAVGGTLLAASIIWLSQAWIYNTVFAGGVQPSQAIIVAVLIKLIFTAATAGYTVTLRAQRWGRPIAVADSVSVAVMVPFVVAGAYWSGIDAAAMSLALQPATALLIFVLAYRYAETNDVTEGMGRDFGT